MKLDRIPDAIINHRRRVLLCFFAVAIVCGVLMLGVGINYNLADYLPDDAPSTKAMKVMEDSFDGALPNASLMVQDVTIPQALEYKERLLTIDGVDDVLWLDDVVDIYQPVSMLDQDTVESWYKDDVALFSITVNEDDSVGTIAKIREIMGPDDAIKGDAVNVAAAQGTLMTQIPTIIMLIFPLAIIILMISTSSWIEPVLFLITIGIAILINEGTNIFLGEISFITRATSAVLQLAVSMDYAVFLLHSYSDCREEGMELKDAMHSAMKRSFPVITASALTTMIGFLALALMRFKIGADLGVVLCKGVFISFISVTVLLPVLALLFTKALDKTRHRPLLPSFKKLARFITKVCIPIAIIIFILIIPTFLAQQNNEFVYGASAMLSNESPEKIQADLVSEKFSQNIQMVILVPEEDIVKESKLCNALKQVNNVDSVISYSTMVGTNIPKDMLNEEQLSQFVSNGYSRIILNVSSDDESDTAFIAVEDIRNMAHKYYQDDYYLVGQSVVNYDLKNTITGDNLVVTLGAIIAVGLVILFMFKSWSMPLILLLTIEGAIWINMSLPYFTGDTMNYIGYQIISAVQLGATVDYGILFAKRYLNNREILDAKAASQKTISDTAASIMTPALILAIAGMSLGVISTNGIIQQMGIILGRGALISALMVLLFLPALLRIFDKVIQKSNFRLSFKKKGKEL